MELIHPTKPQTKATAKRRHDRLAHLSTNARAFVRALELMYRECDASSVEMMVPDIIDDSEVLPIMRALQDRYNGAGLVIEPSLRRGRFITI